MLIPHRPDSLNSDHVVQIHLSALRAHALPHTHTTIHKLEGMGGRDRLGHLHVEGGVAEVPGAAAGPGRAPRPSIAAAAHTDRHRYTEKIHDLTLTWKAGTITGHSHGPTNLFLRSISSRVSALDIPLRVRALPPPEVPTDSPEDPAVAVAASDRFLGGLSEGGGRLPLDGPALNPRYAFGEDCGETRQDEKRQDSLDPEREGRRGKGQGERAWQGQVQGHGPLDCSPRCLLRCRRWRRRVDLTCPGLCCGGGGFRS
jgi:hypothetical protein